MKTSDLIKENNALREQLSLDIHHSFLRQYLTKLSDIMSSVLNERGIFNGNF
ncbi:hypothetical protein [Lactococcus kimchii]|uniref:hypothetical protein n=1 Tax=Lactococcus sp. S-13 TaxID=2507158 RepID=UPI00168134E9|nr:hypothetical protein [Lactococcus sp. S-13]